MKCFRVIAHDHDAAQALGQRSHIVQVEAIGQFKSKAAFARGLVAAGLFATERSALSQINHSGGETYNDCSRAVAGTMPETVFVGPLNKTSTDVFIAWPPQRTVLQRPVPPLMSQLAESDRISRAADEGVAVVVDGRLRAPSCRCIEHLSDLLNDLPTGHHEKPGLIRAIELLRSER